MLIFDLNVGNVMVNEHDYRTLPKVIEVWSSGIEDCGQSTSATSWVLLTGTLFDRRWGCYTTITRKLRLTASVYRDLAS